MSWQSFPSRTLILSTSFHTTHPPGAAQCTTLHCCCRYLHGNNLTGGVPGTWGLPGSFTALQTLTLQDNPLLGGTLPAGWGNASTALPKLNVVNMSGSGLVGTLPAAWGPGPQSLQTL